MKNHLFIALLQDILAQVQIDNLHQFSPIHGSVLFDSSPESGKSFWLENSKRERWAINPLYDSLVVVVGKQRPEKVPEHNRAHVSGPQMWEHSGHIGIQISYFYRLCGMKLHWQWQGCLRGGLF